MNEWFLFRASGNRIETVGVTFEAPLTVLHVSSNFQVWHKKSIHGWAGQGRRGPHPAWYLLIETKPEVDSWGRRPCRILETVIPSYRWKKARAALVTRCEEMAALEQV